MPSLGTMAKSVGVGNSARNAGVAQYGDAAVRHPAVLDLRSRVRVERDPAIPVGAATLMIELQDGSKLSKHVEHARGSIERPLTDAEIEAKVRTLARTAGPLGMWTGSSRQFGPSIGARMRGSSCNLLRPAVDLKQITRRKIMRSWMRKLGALLIAAMLLPALAAPAAAEDYPNRPITIVVPFSAGGPADVIARLLMNPMGKDLKQSIVVENAVGAGGTIGTNRVAKAAPDGYTLLLMHVGQSTAPSLYAKLPFDPVADFAPIGLVADVPMILVSRPKFPANDLKELVANIRQNGDKVTYGNVGRGSASHLCGLLFMNAIGANMNAVYYKGGGPALNDVIAGHIDVYCEPATGPTPHVSAGTIKGYAVTSKKRVPALPNVPTSAEAGLPQLDVTTWYGMYAPRGTPKPVVDKLVGALQKALADPAVVKRFAELSMEPVEQERATPAALEAFLKAEIEKWSRIIKAAGIEPQ